MKLIDYSNELEKKTEGIDVNLYLLVFLTCVTR